MTDPKRCKATNRAGEQCGRPPMRGGRVCASHGGKSPRVLAAAQRNLAEAEAIREVTRLSDARGPLSLSEVYREMLRTAGLAVAWRDVLEAKVSSLEDYAGVNGLGAEQVRADVALFERALDRTAKVLELIARLDLDSRLTNMGEDLGRQVVAMIRRAVADVDFTPEQEARFNAAIARELRAASEQDRDR